MDSGNITALMVACRLNQLEAVKLLADYNVNAQSGYGCTALYLAAEEGDLRIVCCLLGCGANVALVASDGSSPLHCSCRFGHEQV